MTNAAAPQQEIAYTALPDVSPEDWNNILLEVSKETVEKVEELLLEMFPDWVISPGVKRTQQEWLVWFVQRLNAAYPLYQVDPYQAEMRQLELGWTLDENWLPLMRMGQAPLPISRPWAGLMVNGIVFRAIQKFWRQVYRDQGRKLGYDV